MHSAKPFRSLRDPCSRPFGYRYERIGRRQRVLESAEEGLLPAAHLHLFNPARPYFMHLGGTVIAESGCRRTRHYASCIIKLASIVLVVSLDSHFLDDEGKVKCWWCVSKKELGN